MSIRPRVTAWAANESLHRKESRAQTVMMMFSRSCVTRPVWLELVVRQAGFHANAIEDDVEEHQYSTRPFRLVLVLINGNAKLVGDFQDNLHLVVCNGCNRL